jgi:hypothetical protein
MWRVVGLFTCSVLFAAAGIYGIALAVQPHGPYYRYQYLQPTNGTDRGVPVQQRYLEYEDRHIYLSPAESIYLALGTTAALVCSMVTSFLAMRRLNDCMQCKGAALTEPEEELSGTGSV